MNFFSMPKPRRFNHRPIYSDPRRDLLRQLERETRTDDSGSKTDGEGDRLSQDRGMGYGRVGEQTRERLHDAIMRDMRHLRRHREHRSSGCLAMNIAVVLILLLVLIVVWRLLFRL